MSKNVNNIGKGTGYCQKEKQKKDKTFYDLNPHKCGYCNSVISYEKRKNKFCGHSCSASFNNKGVKRNHSSRSLNNCLYCNTETLNIKYCSQTCMNQSYIDETVEQIQKTGVLPTHKSGGITVGARKYLISQRGRKCEKCENDRWMGVLIPIEFHHKNGNPDDNRETNIQILCSNCHAITINHRGRNKNGNGRWSRKNKNRRQRYAEGKSY